MKYRLGTETWNGKIVEKNDNSQSLDFVVAGVFYWSSLVVGYFFFVFSNLLLDFADRQVQRNQDRRGLRRGHEVGGMFGRNVDFDGGLVQMFEIYSHFDRIDSIE